MISSLFYDKPHYSIDTSALIDWWKFYPRDVFPGIYLTLKNLIVERRLQASLQVYEEVDGDKNDPLELANWCKNHAGLFCPDDERVQTKVSELMSKYQKPKRPNGIRKADPFVIAHAAIGGKEWHVVSHEHPKNGSMEKNPNIPFVCEQEEIKHITFMDILRCEGWTDSN